MQFINVWKFAAWKWFSHFQFSRFYFNKVVRRCKCSGKCCDDDVMNESMCQKRDQVSRASTFYANLRYQFLSFCFPFHLEQNINIWCVGICFPWTFFPCRNKFIHHRVSIFRTFSLATFLMTLSGVESSEKHRNNLNRLFNFMGIILCVTGWFGSKYEPIRFSSPRLCFSRHQNRPKTHKAADCFTFPSHSPNFSLSRRSFFVRSF